ncbi:chorismate--pyruvate lyase family protein [Amphibiibacter pelophylacis]|uniref:Uncharacterized protein n=1 Tax=Amphibiibacter pelophylacis TaxID=1799477 RepID=A0ACC6NY38_9BURK
MTPPSTSVVRGSARHRLKRWQCAPGSLTAHLNRTYADRGGIRVRVLPVRRPATAWERRQIGARPGEALWLREVALCCGDEVLVHARSVAQVRATRLMWRCLLGLGSRAMAEVLFAPRRTPLSRTPLRALARPVAGCGGNQGPHVPARQRDQSVSLTGGRCSVFGRAGASLLVSEWFSSAIRRLKKLGSTRA